MLCHAQGIVRSNTPPCFPRADKGRCRTPCIRAVAFGAGRWTRRRTLCSGISAARASTNPPHSLQRPSGGHARSVPFRRNPCSTPCLRRPCIQRPLPPHSLQRALRRLCEQNAFEHTLGLSGGFPWPGVMRHLRKRCAACQCSRYYARFCSDFHQSGAMRNGCAGRGGNRRHRVLLLQPWRAQCRRGR